MTPRTAAHDSVLRLALAMFANDPRSACTDAQRDWIHARLTRWLASPGGDDRLTPTERARLQAPLLAYCRAHRPTILAIVAAQFPPEEEMPHGDTQA